MDRAIAQRNHLKQTHVVATNYVTEHPELASLLDDFTVAVLIQRPENIQEFARGYFASLQKNSTPPHQLEVYKS